MTEVSSQDLKLEGAAPTGDHIVIVDYDSRWLGLYQDERSRILAALGEAVVDIEHIGRTAVPGLAAKPIIDIQVGVRRLPLAEAHLEALVEVGYGAQRYNEPWWVFLGKGMPRTHHLYLIDISTDAGREHWAKDVLFRDYLRAHAPEARRYEELKRELAARFTTKRRGYEEAKTEFVGATLQRGRVWRRSQE